MAQVLFADLMTNHNDFSTIFGMEREYAYKVSIKYREDMSNTEFLDWIINNLEGAVVLRNDTLMFGHETILLFNSKANYFSLGLAFGGETSYGDKKLWTWHYDSNKQRFERHKP